MKDYRCRKSMIISMEPWMQNLAQLLRIAPLALLVNGTSVLARGSFERNGTVRDGLQTISVQNQINETESKPNPLLLAKPEPSIIFQHKQSSTAEETINDLPEKGLSERADLLLQQGIEYAQTSQYSEALDAFETALDTYLELGDRLGEANTLGNIGVIYQAKGSYAKALDYYQQSLEIKRQLGNRAEEAITLGNIGIIYRLQGSYAEALDYYQQSLEISRELNDREGIAVNLGNISVIYQMNGSYAEALDYYRQSLELYRELGDRIGEAITLGNIGIIYRLQDSYAEALHYYQQSLEIKRELGNRLGEAKTLSNIGIVYRLQGSYAEALDYYQKSLEISRELDTRAEEAITLGNVGSIYQLQYNYAEALDYYQQSLKLKRELGDREGVAITLGNVGNIYQLQSSDAEALDYYQQSLELSRQLGNRAAEALAIGNIGVIYQSRGKYAEALDYYQQSLELSRQLGNRAEEARTLVNIGTLFKAQDQPALAITFLKQSVNTYESIRGSNRKLSQELQESYTTTIEKDYRRLADLLLQQNRILEAQQVLDLLKVQELDEYLRGVRGTGTTLSILRPEEAILEKHNELTATAAELGQELTALKEIEEATRSPEQSQRILTLISLQEDITQQFRDFANSQDIRDLLAELTPTLADATVPLTAFNRIQRELPQLDAALIYPLILEDRLEIVVMLPGVPPLRRTVKDLTNTELNSAILTLRQALNDPTRNPLPAAQQLYDWLIRPIEADLAQAGVTSLIYAPDGQLRYIPLAALHDGDRWLIERYQLNNITAESLTEFDDAPAANPRVLAGAFADASITHPVEIDGKTITYAGLPFAGTELDNLEASQPNIKSFRDRSFTLNAVKGIMNEYEILHFATHAAFVNSNPEDSFILFGNGDHPNLLDIGNWTLTNVDLVVLSACETGLDGFGNGAEILGMGYQFQLSGAGAVMASLWSVSDRGTQDLMARFYDRLGNDQPKAKALQQAQIDLINSSDEDIAEAMRRGGLAPTSTIQNLPESLKGFRHPHYWAPFILIGNGL